MRQNLQSARRKLKVDLQIILKKTTTLLNLQNMFRLLSSSVDRFTKR